MLGYQNKVLRIDLSKNNISTEPLNMDWAKKYIGGKGLGIKYLFEELKPNIDPLSPENKLILMTGPVTGTVVPVSGKLTMVTRSPATGTILDCSIGGHIGIAVKYAGYDAVILEGALKEPGYIYIKDDKVEILPAGDLWGIGSHKAEDMLIDKYGRDAKVLSIGPAGENLVGMSCINTDYFRQAGRGGIGAVMGSKNLKAIVVEGTGGVKIHNISEALEKIRQMMRTDTHDEENMYIYEEGTPALVELTNATGILPRENFQDATFEEWEGLSSEKLQSNRVAKKGCASCGLGCGNVTKVNKTMVEGPEYETLALGGPNCGIADLETVVKFNKICDDLGLDTMSTGTTLSYAMEMTEKGLHDFGIKFGDKQKMLEYTEMMARKEGIGAELSMGVKKLSEKYGGEEFAMHSKGLEMPGYEPRGSWGMGLSYAVADRGADHGRAYSCVDEVYTPDGIMPYTAEGKGQLIYDLLVNSGARWSMPLCDFWPLTLETGAELLTIITGEKFEESDMEKIGRRVVSLARLFNQREGFARKDDSLPKRILTEKLKSGPAEGQVISEENFNKMLSDFYEASGLDEHGILSDAKIKEFDL